MVMFGVDQIEETKVEKVFKRTSDFSIYEIENVREMLRGKQPFSIYSALFDLKRGIDNRWFHLNGSKGLVMAIQFDKLRVFSVIGEIEKDTIATIASNPFRSEFHIPENYSHQINEVAATRIVRFANLKYYLLNRNEKFELPSADVRLLTVSSYNQVNEFYSKFYDGTILSSWMLEQPFIGLFLAGKLISAGGSVVIDSFGKAAKHREFFDRSSTQGTRLCKNRCEGTDQSPV